jgi:lipopolysaccharide/colanic/teichoic acid biosynthesis glycosyltransferase
MSDNSANSLVSYMHYEKHTEFSMKQLIYLKIKRMLDLILAIVLLIPASIIMFIFAFWIKAESKGPVLYSQRRPGYKKRIFSIYKLRSMRLELADELGRPLTDKERLTKSGYWARKTSIDELPQLFNIMKGEMSFIGPRPQLINDLPSFTDEQLCRFDVLPGITSLPAIHGRNNQSLKTKYNWDTYYVKNIGLKIDMEIFFKTIIQIFLQKDIDDEVNEVIPAAMIMTDDKNE